MCVCVYVCEIVKNQQTNKTNTYILTPHQKKQSI